MNPTLSTHVAQAVISERHRAADRHRMARRAARRTAESGATQSPAKTSRLSAAVRWRRVLAGE